MLSSSSLNLSSYSDLYWSLCLHKNMKMNLRCRNSMTERFGGLCTKPGGYIFFIGIFSGLLGVIQLNLNQQDKELEGVWIFSVIYIKEAVAGQTCSLCRRSSSCAKRTLSSMFCLWRYSLSFCRRVTDCCNVATWRTREEAAKNKPTSVRSKVTGRCICVAPLC